MRRGELSVKRSHNVHPGIYCVGVVRGKGREARGNTAFLLFFFYFRAPKEY